MPLLFSFCPTLTPFFSMKKEAEIEKSNSLSRQSYAIGLSEYRKIKVLSCSSFSGKIRLLFVLFWLLFAKKGAWSKIKGSESKSNLAHVTNTTPGIQNLQRVCSHYMPVLSLSMSKVIFFLISNHFFYFGSFSRYHTHVFK